MELLGAPGSEIFTYSFCQSISKILLNYNIFLMFPHQDSEMVGVDLRTSMGCNLKNPVECASLTLDTFLVLSLIFFF